MSQHLGKRKFELPPRIKWTRKVRAKDVRAVLSVSKPPLNGCKCASTTRNAAAKAGWAAYVERRLLEKEAPFRAAGHNNDGYVWHGEINGKPFRFEEMRACPKCSTPGRDGVNPCKFLRLTWPWTAAEHEENRAELRRRFEVEGGHALDGGDCGPCTGPCEPRHCYAVPYRGWVAYTSPGFYVPSSPSYAPRSMSPPVLAAGEEKKEKEVIVLSDDEMEQKHPVPKHNRYGSSCEECGEKNGPAVKCRLQVDADPPVPRRARCKPVAMPLSPILVGRPGTPRHCYVSQNDGVCQRCKKHGRRCMCGDCVPANQQGLEINPPDQCSCICSACD